jgi:hypothetical protein
MGLDTYAYHGDRDEMMDDALFAHLPVGVASIGMFSAGSNSFRGKTYAGFMSASVGVDLYREEIPAAEVRGIAHALQDWVAERSNEGIADAAAAGELGGYAITPAEVRWLAEWFAVVAQHNGRVIGWY